MKYCVFCGKELKDDAVYCKQCGSAVSDDRNDAAQKTDLVTLARNGDGQAIATLYEQTYSKVYYTVRSMIKDEDAAFDIIQDSYIKAFSSLDRISGENSFLPWVRTIAANTARDWLRKKRPMLFSDLSTGDDPDMPVEEMFEDKNTAHIPEMVIDQDETKRLVREIIEELPEDQRAAIGMYYYEEMSVKEIASAMGATENTVKSRLLYARRKIEKKVRELEKAGTKLYSLAPVPFLLMLIRNLKFNAAETPDPNILQSIIGGAAAGSIGTAGSAAAAGVTAKTAAGVGAKTAAGVSTKAAGLGAAKIAAVSIASAAVIGGGIYGVTTLTSQDVARPIRFVREDTTNGSYLFHDTFTDSDGIHAIYSQLYILGDGILNQESMERLDVSGRAIEKHRINYLSESGEVSGEEWISYGYTEDDCTVSVHWKEKYYDGNTAEAEVSYTMESPENEIECRVSRYDSRAPEWLYFNEYHTVQNESGVSRTLVRSSEIHLNESEITRDIYIPDAALPLPKGKYTRRMELDEGNYLILYHDDSGRLINRTRYDQDGIPVTDYHCVFDSEGREVEVFCSRNEEDGSREEYRTTYEYKPGDETVTIKWQAERTYKNMGGSYSGEEEYTYRMHGPESHVKFIPRRINERKTGRALSVTDISLYEYCTGRIDLPEDPFIRRIDRDDIYYHIEVYDPDGILLGQTDYQANNRQTQDRVFHYDLMNHNQSKRTEEYLAVYLDTDLISQEHVIYGYEPDSTAVTIQWEMTDHGGGDTCTGSEVFDFVMMNSLNQVILIRDGDCRKTDGGTLEIGEYHISEIGPGEFPFYGPNGQPVILYTPLPPADTSQVNPEPGSQPETTQEIPPETEPETVPMEDQTLVDASSEEKGSYTLSAAEDWTANERSAGRIPLTGTIDTYDYYEVIELQGMPDANPGVTDRSITYRIIVLDEEQTLSGTQDIWSGSRKVSAIYVPDAGIPLDLDGRHITFSIAEGSLNWPGGTDLPLGMPRCRDIHYFE